MGLPIPEVVAQALLEVAPLLALRGEPVDGPVRENRVQDHQTMNRPVDCDASSISVVRLANRRVHRFVVHMDDPRPSGRAEFDRSREPPDEERLDEVVNFLSVRDAGERRILSADEYAGVSHHSDEETCLTVRQVERRERSIALGG
jgi:hypothetical protein